MELAVVSDIGVSEVYVSMMVHHLLMEIGELGLITVTVLKTVALV